jgi:phosphosulfolactate synthase
MMNFDLPFIPERPEKSRDHGLTMMMDKGLSVGEIEDFIEACGDYTDVVKFGFGTSLITANLETKLNLYREAEITPFFGGTLFEAFIARDKFEDYQRFLDKYDMTLAEISDGSIVLPHDQKLAYIQKLGEQVTVLSEVGSKAADVHLSSDQWVEQMKTELEAGVWKVIAEARESGTIGIYNKDGSANVELIDSIRNHVKLENVLWEAPQKNQQVWFIQEMGANVNLGNIAPNEVISLEALRLGLRGDTFFEFLAPEMIEQYSHKY